MRPSRLLERAKAHALGYFWLPCPICGDCFGGHEWGRGRGASIPVRNEPGRSIGVCPKCTKRREDQMTDRDFDTEERAMWGGTLSELARRRPTTAVSSAGADTTPK